MASGSRFSTRPFTDLVWHFLYLLSEVFGGIQVLEGKQNLVDIGLVGVGYSEDIVSLSALVQQGLCFKGIFVHVFCFV